jgi:hypothetical protein
VADLSLPRYRLREWIAVEPSDARLRLIHMRAQRRSGGDTRLRAAALLLACALALAVGAIGRPVHTQKHVPRAVAAIAVTSADNVASGNRGELPAVSPTDVPAAALARAGAGSAHAYRSVSADTAGSPKVRGPPVEALV